LAAALPATATQEETTREINAAVSLLLQFRRTQAMSAWAAGAIPIGVLHGTVAGAEFSTGFTPRGISIEFTHHDLAEMGCAYWALGHYHKAQSWDGGRIAYAGSTERVNFGEPEEKGVRIVEINASAPGVIHHFSNEFVPLPARKIILLEQDWSDGVGCIDDGYDVRLAGALVRARYRISPENRHLVNEQEMEKSLRAAGAHDVKIEFVPVHEERVRSEEITRAETVWDKELAWAKSREIKMTPEELQRREARLEEIQI
jgi:exonuclease SbcD